MLVLDLQELWVVLRFMHLYSMGALCSWPGRGERRVMEAADPVSLII